MQQVFSFSLSFKLKSSKHVQASWVETGLVDLEILRSNHYQTPFAKHVQDSHAFYFSLPHQQCFQVSANQKRAALRDRPTKNGALCVRRWYISFHWALTLLAHPWIWDSMITTVAAIDISISSSESLKSTTQSVAFCRAIATQFGCHWRHVTPNLNR